ncbi:MAG: type II secretion system F family protein [Verrucomicrobia bacterium]|nr:type II secretion system F family protein [Verrucomicrobiota bacterium]
MPFLVTPRPLQQRADFYHQLAQLTAAGVTLLSALEMAERAPPDRSYRAPLHRVRGAIQEGGTFSEALQQTGAWLPPFDRALLHAGEHSGRLPNCFKLLADHYTDRARLARQVIGDLIYPLLLLHLAVFIFPFAQLFVSGDLPGYLMKTVGVLAPLYAAALVAIWALQGRHKTAWREAVERLLHPIPVLGAARRALALSRLASALEALLSAGVTIIEAWQMAALACGSPVLQREVARWQPQLRSGSTPGEIVSTSRLFPDVFSNLYCTGEASGQLDESLRNLAKYFQEEGTRKLHLVARWAPMLIYFAIVLLVAWKIVQFWLGYFQQINNAIDAVP